MIVPGLTDSFVFEILQGIHQASDVYRLALYNEAANLDPTTEVYTTDGEVIGSKGYTPGGQNLKGYVVKKFGSISIMSFDNPVWQQATISARGALIYNVSKHNRAVVVLDFGVNIVGTNGQFLVTLPPATAEDAIIQVGY